MNYLLDLFTPETWRGFQSNGATVTGFRERQRRLALKRVKHGDIFICYLTRLSRWCGLLQVESDLYHDDSPIFADPDPFIVRFRVKPIVVLNPEVAIPIHDHKLWNALTITRQYDLRSTHWTGFFRSSLNKFEESDGTHLMQLLKGQNVNPKNYPLTKKDKRHLSFKTKVRTLDEKLVVKVKDHDKEDSIPVSPTIKFPSETSTPTSIRMQSKVAQIGVEMGFQVWVPRNDKVRVQEHLSTSMQNAFLDKLPLNYNETTLKTIEQIDVLWLKDRSMARAFEIEHTTAIYSGLLRMADLLALQPNMDIRLHIVAPDDKRKKVLREIRRPVFSLLKRGPLSEQCSFLSYSSIDTLAKTQYLSYMSDKIIKEYEEFAKT